MPGNAVNKDACNSKHINNQANIALSNGNARGI